MPNFLTNFWSTGVEIDCWPTYHENSDFWLKPWLRNNCRKNHLQYIFLLWSGEYFVLRICCSEVRLTQGNSIFHSKSVLFSSKYRVETRSWPPLEIDQQCWKFVNVVGNWSTPLEIRQRLFGVESLTNFQHPCKS